MLHMDQETKKVSTPESMATFCNVRKLNIYLVRTDLFLIERIVGSHKCKEKGCEVCLNVRKHLSYQFSD